VWAEKEGGESGSGREGPETAGIGEGKRKISADFEQVGDGGD